MINPTPTKEDFSNIGDILIGCLKVPRYKCSHRRSPRLAKMVRVDYSKFYWSVCRSFHHSSIGWLSRLVDCLIVWLFEWIMGSSLGVIVLATKHLPRAGNSVTSTPCRWHCYRYTVPVIMLLAQVLVWIKSPERECVFSVDCFLRVLVMPCWWCEGPAKSLYDRPITWKLVAFFVCLSVCRVEIFN